jgi:RNA polymerase sigma-70 factor (ECF subfamily)
MTTQLAVAPAGDEELLEALRAGDELAFEQLVRRYHRALRRLARSYVPSPADAEEIVQDTWLAVLDGIDRFRGSCSLRTWIFRILINRAITRGARARRLVPFSCLQPESESDVPNVDPDCFTRDGAWAVAPRRFELPEDRAGLLELRAQLRRALATLPERQRVVVALRDVEGRSSEEVCELLGLTAENQRVLLHRGRARLQAVLAPYQAAA